MLAENIVIVHGTSRVGVLKTRWGIDEVMKAMYNQFDGSPAKRGLLKHHRVCGLSFAILWPHGLKIRKFQIENLRSPSM